MNGRAYPVYLKQKGLSMRRVHFLRDYDVEGVVPRTSQSDPVTVIPCGLVVPKGTKGSIVEGSEASYPDVLLDLGLVVRGVPEDYLQPISLVET